MFIPYSYDPRIHRLADLPVTSYLRRELGLDNLVTYHHQEVGTWVVSLRARDGRGDDLVDIGLLGTGEGEGPWCSRENSGQIIRRMKTMIHTSKVRGKLRQNDHNGLRYLQDKTDRVNAAKRDIYLSKYKKYGPMVAEEWAQAVGYEACKKDPDKVLSG